MLYDDQAEHFDERAGIPAEAVDDIAQALADLLGLNERTTLLEIGAGTGLLSLPLLRHPIRYTGFDRSPAMLDVFRGRLGDEVATAELHVADGNARWPADDAGVDAIFSARALHHLDVDHVVAETRRVLCLDGGWLVVGRLRRPHDSVRSMLRRQMRRRLSDQGFAGRNPDAHIDAVFTALEREGGRRLPPIMAARWSVQRAPIDSIQSWEGKEGLAGVELSASVKNHIFADLRSWAEQHYGSLDQPLEQEEGFELSALRLERLPST